MSHTISNPASADDVLRSYLPQRPTAGPMLVALGPRNGASVLRVARSLTPRSAHGVLVVTVAESTTENLDTVDALPNWERRVIAGEPARALAELARQVNAPLIVVGLGRHQPFDRLLGTETALRIVRQSPCPVLAVAHGAAAPMRQVVVATDFSMRSARAAESMIPLLAADAEVHVLHVAPTWEDDDDGCAHSPLAAECAFESDFTGGYESYELALPDRFRRFTESLALPHHATVTHVTKRGRAAPAIIAYANAINADLIVAGRHGRGTLTSMLAGSVTMALLRGAQRSVLVTPEPAFADVDRLSRLLMGASESSDPHEWTIQLDAFSRRNRGRATVVEEDDCCLDAQVLERGYRLLGAAYDPRAHHVELMLGGARSDEAYIRHNIAEVDFLTVATAPDGRDIGLSVQHARGQTLVTFAPD